jgi:foldase protein PrsA
VRKTIRFAAALGAVFFAVGGLAACGGLPGSAVVQVEGTPISKSAFEHWMGVAATSSTGGATSKPTIPVPPNYTACIAHLAATSPPPAKGQSAPTNAQLKSQCETQYKQLQQEVLGFLISSQWVIAEGKALGVKVSDAEVKKQFEKIKSQQFTTAAAFEKFLSTSGQTVSDLLLRVKLNLLSAKIQQKIIKQRGTVTQAQIEKYYNENKARFGAAEKRNVATILTKDEAAAKNAKKEIESGKSFASVAQKVSIDPTSKKNGGLVVGLTKGTQSKALDEAMFSAQKNVLTGPIKTPFGYTVFEVKSITPGSQQSLAQVQPLIKQQLTATQQQEALSKFVKEFKKKWTAKTECRSEYVVADCKEFKAPKGATATTPAG